MIKQLIAQINVGNVKLIKSKIARKLEEDIARFHSLRSQVLHQEYLSGNLGQLETEAIKADDDEMAKAYLKHILKTGSADERQEALAMIKTKFVLTKRELKLK